MVFSDRPRSWCLFIQEYSFSPSAVSGFDVCLEISSPPWGQVKSSPVCSFCSFVGRPFHVGCIRPVAFQLEAAACTVSWSESFTGRLPSPSTAPPHCTAEQVRSCRPPGVWPGAETYCLSRSNTDSRVRKGNRNCGVLLMACFLTHVCSVVIHLFIWHHYPLFHIFHGSSYLFSPMIFKIMFENFQKMGFRLALQSNSRSVEKGAVRLLHLEARRLPLCASPRERERPPGSPRLLSHGASDSRAGVWDCFRWIKSVFRFC